MMKKSLLFFTFFVAVFGQAQTVQSPVSFGYTKITAYSNQFADAFSFADNQGALAAIKGFSAGVYSERRFMLQALSAYSGAIVVPAGPGSFGFRGNYIGDASYNESTVGLAYGRSLGSKIALGVQFNYLRTNVAGYGAASALNFDASAMIHLTSQLNAGVHVYNPLSESWDKEGLEKLPAVYNLGLGYDASKQVFIGAEVEKTEDLPVSVHAGLHVQLAEKLIARVGVQSATSVYYIGFGLRLSRLRVDVTASLHPYLGVSPGLLMLYSSNK